MHFINSSYTTHVNIKRKRIGHLFQGRYKAILVVEEEMENPLRKIYGGVILGGKGFIEDTLRRIESEQAASREISRAEALRATPDLDDILPACCKHFGATREELKNSRRGDSRKACGYPIERHPGATNREIAELFGNLSYSAVAKIDRSVSSRLATDDDRRGLIERMQAEYSLFKA